MPNQQIAVLLVLLPVHRARSLGSCRPGTTSGCNAQSLSPQLNPTDSGVGLTWRSQYETGRVEAYGRDGIRVRFTLGSSIRDDAPGAILGEPELRGGAPGERHRPRSSLRGGAGSVTNGDIRVEVRPHDPRAYSGDSSQVSLEFFRASTGECLLREAWPLHGRPARALAPIARGASAFAAEVAFATDGAERFFGLGQHQHGRLDQRGMVVDLRHLNTEVAVPFLLSSRRYGFVWNVPSPGRVELGGAGNRTRWVAGNTRQVDYLVLAGASHFEVLARLAEATGHAPPVPAAALGYIQSKLRYASQAELLNVTREFRRRRIPLGVIVVDFLHSPHQGDWRFDPRDWPDPAGMLREIRGYGVEVMVSVWPTVELASENYAAMARSGMLVRTEGGGGSQGVYGLTSSFGGVGSEYDPFNPAARAFLWSKLRQNYYDLGVRMFWLDADEGGGDGEGDGGPPPDEVYYAGPHARVGLMYPQQHQRALHEGLAGLNATGETLTLSRSAWLGSQRYGGAVWSGDVESSFEGLRLQVRAGLSMQMSGIALWTTDAGGFLRGRGPGNDVREPYFRELLVRWFQFAATCPLMRNHGARSCAGVAHPGSATCPNEPFAEWYGEATARRLNATIALREGLRPYLAAQLRRASREGRPLMRPLFFDFPGDGEEVWALEDQYMVGDDLMAAPVTAYLARSREVYFPRGRWRDYWDDQVIVEGGQTATWHAPLDRLPLFWLHREAGGILGRRGDQAVVVT
mmetsp:Transcript_93385/g.264364  ORF Transcript_93385/g.264364 Transcript_93385/m.264364 type:complete len:745 (+) Transcript_93385:51-2285(+)